MGQSEKYLVQFVYCRLKGIGCFIGFKNCLESSSVPVNMPESFKKISKINQVECPVHEPYCLIEFAIARIHNEFIRRILEYLHHPCRTSQDHLTVSPGYCCCKESGNFYIAFCGITMRDTYRIRFYEFRPVIEFNLFIKKFLKICLR